MRSVGLFEAKNGLSALVDRVSKGEEIVITRRGQKVAMLVPAHRRWQRSSREVVEHIRKSRKGARIPRGFSIRQLIEQGREL
jgi:prevent-host-death family protein